jgi:hypothetical protein
MGSFASGAATRNDRKPLTHLTLRQDDPIRVAIQPSSQSVMQGEPLTLTYKIVNATDGIVMANLGLRGGDWLNVSLVRADGSEIKALFLKPYGRPRQGSNGVRIEPQQYHTGDRVVPRWASPLSPGEYQLRVRVQLPYDASTGTLDADAIGEGRNSLRVEGLRFPLTVTPEDPDKLRLMAEGLRQEIVFNRGAYTTMIEQLFALPSQYARLAWTSLAQTPNMNTIVRGAIFEQLVLMNDAEAADLLAKAAWDGDTKVATEGEKNWRISCVEGLQRIFNKADAPLKSHITALYVRYTGKEPDSDRVEGGYEGGQP